MPCCLRSGCMPGQDGRQGCSSILPVLQGCCPRLRIEGLSPWPWWDEEVHLYRIWERGCWAETGQSGTNQGRAFVGICLGEFLTSCFCKSGADVGVSWAGRRLLLLGSGSAMQILLSGCLPKAGHDAPAAKLWLEPPELRSVEFPVSHFKCPRMLGDQTAAPTHSQRAFATLCLHFLGVLPLPTSWEEDEEEEGTAALSDAPSPHPLACMEQQCPGYPSLPCSPLPPHFLLPRCVSASVGCGSVPARLITICLPEFPLGHSGWITLSCAGWP